MHEFLPDCEKIPGPSQHLKVAQWMASIDGKEEHDSLKAEWRKNNPPPPKQVPKTAPVASRSNSKVKKQPQAQNKGGEKPATKLTARATGFQIYNQEIPDWPKHHTFIQYMSKKGENQ
ncbi:hypothetical protein O181_120007 [Austropuccinia psidii MF-1]|uniref:Uncharacterized protein n=1 Tax=Austropuccinia psidii MF-1 TaxID=1389203 RepID=A0A9Q3KID7_9BASI|nr:hypothetical protein [Austropuccinia psidii MF-1]